MPLHPRNIAVFLLSLGAALFGARPAAAVAKWQEAHETADDVHLTIEADGSALVERTIRWRVVAGNLTGFDVPFVEKGAVISPGIDILGDDGVRFEGRVERVETPSPPKPGELVPVSPPGDGDTLHVTVDEPAKGLRRGVYLFKIAYRIDLGQAKHLAKDGPMWLLRWVSPPSPEGRDGARVTFTLPPAPTEPRAAVWEEEASTGGPEATGAGAGTEQPTLRRQPDKDEIELMRPHVARGETVSWTIRVDPKALSRIHTSEKAPSRAREEPTTPGRDLERPKTALVALALALAAGLLFHKKRRDAGALAASRGMRASPLVARLASPWLFAPLVGATLALVALSVPWAAALVLVLAMALATFRPPVPLAGLDGVRALAWLPLRESEVLPRRPAPGSVLDVNTRRGKLAVLTLVAAGATAFVLLSDREIRACCMILVAIAAVLPLFLTGTRGQLPFHPAHLSGPLAELRALLSALPDTRVIALGGFAEEGASAPPASVRLGVIPRDVMSGVRGLEIAQVAVAEPSGWYARLELLVRVLDGSDAEGRLKRALPHVRAKPGRKPEERVFHVVPDEGTVAALADLIARVRKALDDRRASIPAPAPPADRRRPRRPPPRDRAPDASAFLGR